MRTVWEGGVVIARPMRIRSHAPPRDSTGRTTMRKCVLALLVSSSLVIVTAAQDQAPGGAPRPLPGAQGEQPRPAPPATQGEQPRPRAPGGAQAASKVTISGCIQNAPTASATPGGAAPAASSSAAKFVLANAKAAEGADAVGTAGSAATRYQLDGEEKTISPHVNHQVEITGTVQPAGAGAAAGAAGAGPMLKVESVKMIAAKCS